MQAESSSAAGRSESAIPRTSLSVVGPGAKKLEAGAVAVATANGVTPGCGEQRMTCGRRESTAFAAASRNSSSSRHASYET